MVVIFSQLFIIKKNKVWVRLALSLLLLNQRRKQFLNNMQSLLGQLRVLEKRLKWVWILEITRLSKLLFLNLIIIREIQIKKLLDVELHKAHLLNQVSNLCLKAKLLMLKMLMINLWCQLLEEKQLKLQAIMKFNHSSQEDLSPTQNLLMLKNKTKKKCKKEFMKRMLAWAKCFNSLRNHVLILQALLHQSPSLLGLRV